MEQCRGFLESRGSSWTQQVRSEVALRLVQAWTNYDVICKLRCYLSLHKQASDNALLLQCGDKGTSLL